MNNLLLLLCNWPVEAMDNEHVVLDTGGQEAVKWNLGQYVITNVAEYDAREISLPYEHGTEQLGVKLWKLWKHVTLNFLLNCVKERLSSYGPNA